MKTNKEIITEIITDLEKTVGLNWPTAWNAKVTRDKLIECWSEYRDIPDWKYFGYMGAGSIHSQYKKLFSNILKDNRQPWKAYIFSKYNYKYCYVCIDLKNTIEFSKNKNSSDNKRYICKVWENNKEKIQITHKKYRQDHREEHNAYSAKHRASKLQRTPSWANEKRTKEIYKNCPEGHHVDHIIPLQGKIVSGLHVPENLQYLTAEENLKKSNKYEVK